jgi:putative DNA primase/helicase
VQRLLGYSIVGEVEQEILPFAVGGGGNGKTALFEMVAGVLGDYATSSPNNFLMAQRQQQHPTEIARLSGARFVMCSEVNENDHFDEAKVKVLCGGDRLTARFMNQDHFTFTPTHQLWLAGNHQPAVDSGGEGFWRRLRIIPFVHTVPKEERRQGLAALLVREEGEAILAWLVAGAAAYASRGLQEPAGVLVATAEYAEAEDNVGRFIEDCCFLAPDSPAVVNVSVSKLWETYEQWCRQNGEQPCPKRSMAARLARHGVLGSDKTPKGTGGVRRYGGIGLRTDEEEPKRVF